MSLNSKVILSFLASTFGALLGWVIVDFNPWYRLQPGPTIGTFMKQISEQWFVGAIFGTMVGLAIGYVNGLWAGSWPQMKRNLGWGAVVGFCGGILGLVFGQLFFGSLYVDPLSVPPLSVMRPFYFVWGIIVRAIGWALIGLFIGVVQGLPSGSKRAARHGAVGGLLGGFVGGTLFEIVPWILPPGTKNPGVVSRAISMTVTGASIGFFIGLVETLLKQAWIRVVQGRNEGKEYVISKPRTTIGRDELADIALFGDRNIAPLHAVIDVQQGRHILHDAGSPIGTLINGQKVTQSVLKDGDIIEIGSMRLEFHEKATASKIPRQVDVPESPPSRPIPQAPGICPFCGGKKDPNTGLCDCSIGASPTSQTISAPTGTGPRLVGISGPYAGQSFILALDTPTTIGREPGRSIQLPMDTTVSRKHARIVNEGGTFVVYDEGSSNGTVVNGMRVNRQELAPGDVIAFGASQFRFEQ